MVKVVLTCFDLQIVCRTDNTWLYTHPDLWLLSQWVRTMLCLGGNECDIFQQRVSCIINHDLCVVVTYCLSTSCSSLDEPQRGTDFSQLCFEYGVSSLNHVYSHTECYCQLWIIVYIFNVGSVFDVSATVLTQLQHAMWPCKQDHAPSHYAWNGQLNNSSSTILPLLLWLALSCSVVTVMTDLFWKIDIMWEIQYK